MLAWKRKRHFDFCYLENPRMGVWDRECDSKSSEFGIVLVSFEFKEFAGVEGTSVLFKMGIILDGFRLL